jgi:hypothetical protein
VLSLKLVKADNTRPDTPTRLQLLRVTSCCQIIVCEWLILALAGSFGKGVFPRAEENLSGSGNLDGFRISHLSVSADMFAAVALEDGHNLDPSRYPSVPMRV